MYLLVGLGNPGSKYKRNRHNVGHMTIDMIVKKHGFKVTGEVTLKNGPIVPLMWRDPLFE